MCSGLERSGAHALAQFVERCYAQSVPVILVVGSRNVRDILRRTGLLSHLSSGFVAETINEGLRLAANLLNRITCRDGRCTVPAPDLPPAPPPEETAAVIAGAANEAGAAAGVIPTQADQTESPLLDPAAVKRPDHQNGEPEAACRENTTPTKQP